MKMLRGILLAAPVLALALGACELASPYDKPGFATEMHDGRLWVFQAGSKDHANFKAHGEPAKVVTRIGEGPNGLTIKSNDGKVIDAYLAAK